MIVGKRNMAAAKAGNANANAEKQASGMFKLIERGKNANKTEHCGVVCGQFQRNHFARVRAVGQGA